MSHLRIVLRNLVRNRAYAAVVIATMALGIAGVAVVFALVDSILLRPLVYRDPGRLVSITEIVPEYSQIAPRLAVNARHFETWRTEAKSFDQMSLIVPRSMVLSRSGEPIKISTAMVSSGFFEMLGVQPQLGRAFLADEDRFGGPSVAIITDHLWAAHFHRDPAILGMPIYLDGHPATVVGVLGPDYRPPVTHAADFNTLSRDTDVYVPAALNLADIGLEGEHNYGALARLKPGVSIARAQSELNVIQAAIARQIQDRIHLGADLAPLASEVVGGTRAGLIALVGAISAVFLIICVNLANLSLARGLAQTRDHSIRRALGAGRWEIIRRGLFESILLSLTGGVLGCALAYAGLRLLLHYAPVDLPRLDEVAIDARVLACAFLLAALAGALFGIVPALQASKADPQGVLRASSHNLTTNRGAARLRDALVGFEVGLGAALTIAAALLVASFVRLLNVDKGYEAEHVVAATVNLPYASYREERDRDPLYRRMIGELQRVPGVTSAAVISRLPLEGEDWIDGVDPGGSKRSFFEKQTANYRFISPDYFRVMGIPILRGRVFEEADRNRNPALISRKVAERLWPGENPLGKKFRRGDPSAPPFEVVGVVNDVRMRIAKEPPLVVYTPYWYRNRAAMSVVVRTPLALAAIVPALRSAIRKTDPEIAVSDVRTMDQVVGASVAQRRFQMNLIGAFAVFALLLASLGIFGVVSWTVRRRRNEIGVRMALGARAQDVHRMVVLQGMRPVAAGLLLGVAGALALGRVLSNLLFQVSSHDPIVFAAVVAALAAVSIIACYWPARSATRANPSDVLRYE